MTRTKKILIGLGVVLILGAIAFANFRFKREQGVTVNTEAIRKRDLNAIVSASGKIQPKRSVNISADTMGRVTNLAINEGDRVARGQFLLQIDPRNLRSAVQRNEASMQAARSQAEQLRLGLDSARTALKQAEDGDGLIIRLHEAHGRRGDAILSFATALAGIDAVDLLESAGDTDRDLLPQIEQANPHTVRIPVRPFQIVTLRLRPVTELR